MDLLQMPEFLSRRGLLLLGK